jgi:hypothetical protein
MPYAAKQIDEIYGVPEYSKVDELSARFVHYTTAEAALKIISSKRVWMRNTQCMIDFREVQHEFEMLLGFFADKAKGQLFFDAFDLSWPGVAKEAVGLFDGWLPDIRAHTYIAALSKHHDNEDMNGRLSMWRAFGGSTVPRVAIVLKVPFLSGGADALKILFSPVAYLDESGVHDVMHSIIDNAKREAEFLKTVDRSQIIAYIFQMLLAAVVSLKHEGFKEEAEWRAIYFPNRQSSPLMTPSTEVIGGVPQLVYKLPLDGTVSVELAGLEFSVLFDRLIIGPSQYPGPMWMAFVAALKRSGVKDAENRVVASRIPIRG